MTHPLYAKKQSGKTPITGDEFFKKAVLDGERDFSNIIFPENLNLDEHDGIEEFRKTCLESGGELIFSGSVLCGLVVSNLCLEEVEIEGANLDGAVLCDVDLTDALLRGTSMRRSELTNVILNHADMHAVFLHEATLHNVNAREVYLHGAILLRAMIQLSDFSFSALDRAYCKGVVFEETCLVGMNAHYANFSRASFLNVDVSRADFLEARFKSANVSGMKNLLLAKNLTLLRE